MKWPYRGDKKYEWHRWFAWYPVLIYTEIDWENVNPQEENNFEQKWVWLEIVERCYWSPDAIGHVYRRANKVKN